MDEKRGSPRFRIKQFVTCNPEGDEYYRVETVDISKGGMKCRTAHAVQPMTEVFFIIKVPHAGGEEREVDCEGYISHSQMVEGVCVFGIRFTSIDPEGKADFEAFVDTLEREGEPAP